MRQMDPINACGGWFASKHSQSFWHLFRLTLEAMPLLKYYSFLVLLKAWLILPDALGFSDNTPEHCQLAGISKLFPFLGWMRKDLSEQTGHRAREASLTPGQKKMPLGELADFSLSDGVPFSSFAFRKKHSPGCYSPPTYVYLLTREHNKTIF